jgi:uncharacterized phiE125 gp8 family phage protein
MAQLTLTATGTAQVFTEPLSVAEVEHFLRLPALSPEDEDRTALLESLIITARELAEGYQGRDLVEKQWDLTLSGFASVIELRTPLVSVDLVQYTDSDGNTTALTENTDFIKDTSKEPGVIMPVYGGSWPSFTAWPTSPVLVRFTSGLGSTDIFWSDAGQRVLIGMKKLIDIWYNEASILPPGSSGASVPFGIEILLSTGAVPRAR